MEQIYDIFWWSQLFVLYIIYCNKFYVMLFQEYVVLGIILILEFCPQLYIWHITNIR
jgi:hypothetical protein